MSTKYEKLSQQRKILQEEGNAPGWLTTAGFQLLTEKNYLDIGETPKNMYSRIAKRASELTEVEIPENWGYSNWEDAFFDVIWEGWLSPASPVLTSMGNNRGHPISCSGTYLGDSIRSWYEARMEMAQLTQRGYGTSTVLSEVRPRGSAISTGGSANGIMQPASGVVQDMKDVSQGSSRRGSAGLYVDVLHEDFNEIADQILADDDGWNVGWNITDAYENLFYTDPEKADEIWKKMLKIKLIKGKGYFFFLDKVNRSRPQVYKDKDFFIKGSNLCVSGDTKITIRYDDLESEIEIENLQYFLDKYESVEVLSMNIETKEREFKKISNFAMTHKSSKVMTITDELTGKQITCTEDHKIFTKNRGYVIAGELKEDDELEFL